MNISTLLIVLRPSIFSCRKYELPQENVFHYNDVTHTDCGDSDCYWLLGEMRVRCRKNWIN